MTAGLFGAWPEPDSVKIVNHDGVQWYRTPEGDFARTTAICKLLGTGTEGLIKWSATSERAAVMEACSEVVKLAKIRGDLDVPDNFVATVEEKLGKARAHQRILAKAGDIGTEIHRRIQWHLQRELGQTVGHEPILSMPAAVGFSSWRAWWISSGLTPVRIEQPIWDAHIGYAGTIDLIARAKDGCLEVWDWKSSKGVYDTHHLQLAAYVNAASQWEVVRPGSIVRTPKETGGSLEVEVHALGHLYDGRILSLDELLDGFRSCKRLHDLFVAPRKLAEAS